ncbi:MAG: hypothetical protein J6A02_11060 [Prevotella sp.]|nr:hypothetical protein [Prevotella sp.]
MKKYLLYIASLMLVFTSCSKDILPENEESGFAKEANSILNIHTRTGTDANGDAIISYPVNVYVFNESDECVEYLTLANSEDVLSLNLIEGTYTIYSIGSTSSDSYTLPSKEDATATSVIQLASGKNHSDVMTAKNVVTLVDGEENNLTLAFERKVMLLQEIKIENVPSATTAVSVDIAPLYKDICINGGYSGDNGAQSITLTKEDATKTWSNTENIYLLPASGKATISVKMTNAEGTKSYSYTCADEFIANYKIKIQGKYTAKVGVTLTGTITGATWAGEKTITFEFDENSSSGSTVTDPNEGTEGDDETTGGETTNSDIPAVGTFYKDCYVLKHDVNNTTNLTTVTLLSIAHYDIEITETDQESIKSKINNSLGQFTINDISNWRLINADDLSYINENIESINKVFTDNEKGYAFINGTNVYYYYLSENNEIKTFIFDNKYNMTDRYPSGTNQLRAVTTITFPNK